MQGALKTLKKLKLRKEVDSDLCLLCCAQQETEQHLIECPYEKVVWKSLLKAMGTSAYIWQDELQWLVESRARGLKWMQEG